MCDTCDVMCDFFVEREISVYAMIPWVDSRSVEVGNIGTDRIVKIVAVM